MQYEPVRIDPLTVTSSDHWDVETSPYQREDGSVVWGARHPALPGLVAQAPTEAEAREALDELRGQYFGDLVAEGLPIPRPPTRASFYVSFRHNLPAAWVAAGSEVTVGVASTTSIPKDLQPV